jgi:integrase
MLDQALNDGVIDRNPLDKLVLSKLINKKTSHSDWEVDPFDQDEIKAILNEATGQARNLFQFAFFAGLRTSELIALEWDDIDWLKGMVRVSRAVVLKQEKGTKTKSGSRDVLLLPPALEALKIKKHSRTLKVSGYFIILAPTPHGKPMARFVKLVGRIF